MIGLRDDMTAINSQNTKLIYSQPSEQLFPKQVATQQHKTELKII